MENIKSLLVKFFGNLGTKASHFLFAYLLAALAIPIFGIIKDLVGGIVGTSEDFSGIFFGLLIAPIFFPAGLGAVLTKLWELFSRNSADMLGWLLTGWLAYIVTFLFASYTENMRPRKIWYFIFIFLIVLNFYGCATEEWNLR